jgi:hypothetical protein
MQKNFQPASGVLGGIIQPALLATFKGIVTVYIKQYGPGNLRLAPTFDELNNTISQGPGQVADGIVQVTANGWVQYFLGPGDPWAVSDAPGVVVWCAWPYEFQLTRGSLVAPAG